MTMSIWLRSYTRTVLPEKSKAGAQPALTEQQPPPEGAHPSRGGQAGCALP